MRLAVRIALVLAAALLLAESVLQIASLAVRGSSARDSAPAGAGDARRILCVGDSHTFGLPLPPEQSYPAQLEALLAERHPERRFEVYNLGIPGMNSAFAANRLERQILQLGPAIVIVWVGINNQWNVVETTAEAGESFAAPLRRALFHSRLFRLASIVWYTRTGHQYDPEAQGGWYEGELPPSGRRPEGAARPEHPAPGLARDLSQMARTARALDVPMIFITYPMRKQRPTNREIERAGFEAGVPVLDGIAELERAVADGYAIRDLIDTSQGPHPTGRLYGYVVRSLVPILDEQLGLSRGEPASSP